MKRKKPKGYEYLCVGCPNEIRSAKWCEEYGACPEGRREDWGETAGNRPEETAKVKELELQDATLGRMFRKAAEKEKALTARVAELEEQLAASQRRELTAMKAMEETAADVEAMAKEFEELSREWTEAWARTRALGHRDPDTGQWVVDDPDRELRERWVRDAHREALRHADDVGQGIDNRLAALRGPQEDEEGRP